MALWCMCHPHVIHSEANPRPGRPSGGLYLVLQCGNLQRNIYSQDMISSFQDFKKKKKKGKARKEDAIAKQWLWDIQQRRGQSRLILCRDTSHGHTGVWGKRGGGSQHYDALYLRLDVHQSHSLKRDSSTTVEFTTPKRGRSFPTAPPPLFGMMLI